MLYHLPYGKTEISVDISGDVKLIKPNIARIPENEENEIERALKNPISSQRLSEIAKRGRNAVIIVNDITRPTPTARLLPQLVSELKQGGLEDITIVFGLGIHRKQSEEEKRSILGDLYGKIRNIEHDPDDCAYIGTTSRGTPVEIFRPVADADIVICTGAIEFHYYAGYSGGAKSVLPAVSSRRSIYANHALMLEPKCTAGRLDGPVRGDIEEAGAILGIDFILNVVLNERKEIIFAVAGDYIEAHRKCIDFLDNISKIRIEPSDIIIVSPGGWPKDIDIYQSHKALEHAKNAVRDRGTIILVAECKEGYGNRVFEEWLNFGRDEIMEKFKSGFVMGGHKAALIAALAKKVDLYLVSSLSDETVKRAYFIPATLREALDTSLLKHEKNAKITVMPYGGSMLAVGSQ